MPAKPRIIFLGTPEFAVSSLEALITGGYPVIAVVTAPDQPSGRGLQLQPSPVKLCATAHNIPILQPEKLKNEEFLRQLADLNADLFIVVAFRMLPEAVWTMPPLGTFNLHASLLPQYRGAAPIHHAVMNGETETGLTTFFLRHEIDTGEIIFQEKMPVGPDETTGELYEKMRTAGAQLVLKTVDAIMSGEIQPMRQETLVNKGVELKSAPKIFKEDCKLDWSNPTDKLFNKIRGLSPIPAAYTMLTSSSGETHQLKIFRAHKNFEKSYPKTGMVLTDGKSYLGITTLDGIIFLDEVQLAGKRRMMTGELLRGFRMEGIWTAQ
jgi:methionyl-tRNA formyltransferase